MLSGLDQIQRMRELMKGEISAQRDEFTRRMARPVMERVESGWCLPGLRWQAQDADDPTIAKFTLGEGHGNESRLREGDHVRLSSGAGGDAYVAVTIFREEEEQQSLWLKRESGGWDEWWLFSDKSGGLLLDADFVDLEGFYQRALDAVLQSAIGQSCILPFLEGQEAGEAADFLTQHEKLADSPMNDRQKDAVAECLSAPRCHLVQGPPGTGKTRALAEMASRCAAAGERVLITSFTHRAIHNALDAIVKLTGNPDQVVKIGTPVFTHGSAWKCHERFTACPLAHDDGGWVVGATPFVLASRVKNVEFDRVIVDEAGQMTMPLALMAMLSGRKWFFFGDGEQLGPVLKSLGQRESREWSCFRMLERLAEKTVLNTGYRMNGTLTSWPSETFYSGELGAAPGIESRRLTIPRPCQEPALREVLSPEFPLVWVAFDHADGTLSQEDEAVAAARLVQALVQSGIRTLDIAVVVPWRRQARRIRHHLRGRLSTQDQRSCIVDTVERMQGQEREVVSTELERFVPLETDSAEDAEIFRSLLHAATRIDHAF